MEIWQAVILGIVEGITEYLPISSTGHLILASALMKLNTPEIKGAVSAFEIVVQGGAILAVVGLYWPRMIQMLRGLLGKDPAGFRLVLNLVIAFIPSALVGLMFKDQIDEYLFHAGPVIAAMGIGGVYMMLFEQWRRGRFSLSRSRSSELEIIDVEPVHALFIGVLQCVSLWPGTSRSMMTITGGMMIGLRPKAAAEFSFLLGLPTLSAACLYALYTDLRGPKGDAASGVEHQNLFQVLGPTSVVVGLVVAAVSAAIAVKWLVGFLNTYGLMPFAWYRVVMALVLLGMAMAGMLTVSK